MTKIVTKKTQRKSDKIAVDSIEKLLNTQKSLYEVIDGPCVPYYDFDPSYPTEAERAANEQSDYSKHYAAVQAVFPKGKLYVMTSYGESKGKFKNGLHITVRGVGYASCGAALPVVEHADTKVYKQSGKRQLFRMPGFSKEGEDRPMSYDPAIKYEKFCPSYLYNSKLMWQTKEELTEQMEQIEQMKIRVLEVCPARLEGRTVKSVDLENKIIYYHDVVKQACHVCNEIHEDDCFSLQFREASGSLIEGNYQKARIELRCSLKPTMMMEVEYYKKPEPEPEPAEVNNAHELMVKTFPELVAHRTVKSVKGAFTNYREIVKKDCSLCKRTHEDNQFFLVENEGKVYYGCLKSKTPRVYVGSFDNVKTVKTVQTPIDLTKRLDSWNPTKFSETFCSDYKPLMDAIECPGLVAVVSTTGTGKTHACAKYLSAVKDSAGVVSFRISLAKKYKLDFKNFTCYKDVEGRIDASRWICQLDSLYRITTTPKKLVIDEVSQVRRHLLADTFLKNPNYLANRMKLLNLIKNCETVVVMDANTSNTELKWLSGIRGQKPLVFLNTKAPNPKKVYICDSSNRIITMAREDLALDRKIVIAHNGGKTKHEPLRRELLKHAPGKKILVINSETNNQPDVVAALADPNEEFGRYDCIIYSPSVQSGVSYDKKDVFHRIYGIFGNATNSSGDACQMLDRIRHPIETSTCVSIDQYGGNIRDKSIEALRVSMKHLSNEASVIIDSILTREELDGVCERNHDRLNYRKNFIRCQKIYGNEPIVGDISSLDSQGEKKRAKEEKKQLQSIKCFRDEVNTERAQAICDAQTINKTELSVLLERIKAKNDALTEELNSIKKFMLTQHYQMPEPATTMEWYKTYSDSKLQEHYKRQSRYFSSEPLTLDAALENLRVSEVRNDDWNKRDHEGEELCEDQYVVNTLLKKPVYQKEKVLIGWLKTLGYDGLASSVEVSHANMITKLKTLVSDLNDDSILLLEKKKVKITALKALQETDGDKFLTSALQFINGSLKSYFNITIAKKTKNIKRYVIKNKPVEDGIFKAEAPEIPDEIPVLGLVLEADRPPTFSGLPYDSDDDSDAGDDSDAEDEDE